MRTRYRGAICAPCKSRRPPKRNVNTYPPCSRLHRFAHATRHFINHSAPPPAVSKVSFSVFVGFFVMRTIRTGGLILTIYTSYDVFPRKDVHFGGSVDIPPHLDGRIPKTVILGT